MTNDQILARGGDLCGIVEGEVGVVDPELLDELESLLNRGLVARAEQATLLLRLLRLTLVLANLGSERDPLVDEEVRSDRKSGGSGRGGALAWVGLAKMGSVGAGSSP